VSNSDDNGNGNESAKNLPKTPGRPLLNLQAGDRRGLARAFQALIGRPAAPVPPEAANYAPVLEVLHAIGFTETPQGLTHPLAPDRFVKLTLPTLNPLDPEEAALRWALTHFREVEFYLPFISLQSARQKRLAKSGKRPPRTPEPDYDDDGFLKIDN
jgi:hypothetical protein